MRTRKSSNKAVANALPTPHSVRSSNAQSDSSTNATIVPPATSAQFTRSTRFSARPIVTPTKKLTNNSPQPRSSDSDGQETSQLTKRTRSHTSHPTSIIFITSSTLTSSSSTIIPKENEPRLLPLTANKSGNTSKTQLQFKPQPSSCEEYYQALAAEFKRDQYLPLLSNSESLQQFLPAPSLPIPTHALTTITAPSTSRTSRKSYIACSNTQTTTTTITTTTTTTTITPNQFRYPNFFHPHSLIQLPISTLGQQLYPFPPSLLSSPPLSSASPQPLTLPSMPNFQPSLPQTFASISTLQSKFQSLCSTYPTLSDSSLGCQLIEPFLWLELIHLMNITSQCSFDFPQYNAPSIIPQPAPSQLITSTSSQSRTSRAASKKLHSPPAATPFEIFWSSIAAQVKERVQNSLNLPPSHYNDIHPQPNHQSASTKPKTTTNTTQKTISSLSSTTFDSTYPLYIDPHHCYSSLSETESNQLKAQLTSSFSSTTDTTSVIASKFRSTRQSKVNHLIQASTSSSQPSLNSQVFLPSTADKISSYIPNHPFISYYHAFTYITSIFTLFQPHMASILQLLTSPLFHYNYHYRHIFPHPTLFEHLFASFQQDKQALQSFIIWSTSSSLENRIQSSSDEDIQEQNEESFSKSLDDLSNESYQNPQTISTPLPILSHPTTRQLRRVMRFNSTMHQTLANQSQGNETLSQGAPDSTSAAMTNETVCTTTDDDSTIDDDFDNDDGYNNDEDCLENSSQRSLHRFQTPISSSVFISSTPTSPPRRSSRCSVILPKHASPQYTVPVTTTQSATPRKTLKNNDQVKENDSKANNGTFHDHNFSAAGNGNGDDDDNLDTDDDNDDDDDVDDDDATDKRTSIPQIKNNLPVCSILASHCISTLNPLQRSKFIYDIENFSFFHSILITMRLIILEQLEKEKTTQSRISLQHLVEDDEIADNFIFQDDRELSQPNQTSSQTLHGTKVFTPQQYQPTHPHPQPHPQLRVHRSPLHSPISSISHPLPNSQDNFTTFILSPTQSRSHALSHSHSQSQSQSLSHSQSQSQSQSHSHSQSQSRHQPSSAIISKANLTQLFTSLPDPHTTALFPLIKPTIVLRKRTSIFNFQLNQEPPDRVFEALLLFPQDELLYYLSFCKWYQLEHNLIPTDAIQIDEKQKEPKTPHRPVPYNRPQLRSSHKNTPIAVNTTPLSRHGLYKSTTSFSFDDDLDYGDENDDDGLAINLFSHFNDDQADRTFGDHFPNQLGSSQPLNSQQQPQQHYQQQPSQRQYLQFNSLKPPFATSSRSSFSQTQQTQPLIDQPVEPTRLIIPTTPNATFSHHPFTLQQLPTPRSLLKTSISTPSSSLFRTSTSTLLSSQHLTPTSQSTLQYSPHRSLLATPIQRRTSFYNLTQKPSSHSIGSFNQDSESL